MLQILYVILQCIYTTESTVNKYSQRHHRCFVIRRHTSSAAGGVACSGNVGAEPTAVDSRTLRCSVHLSPVLAEAWKQLKS
jgi:hypothetical protein